MGFSERIDTILNWTERYDCADKQLTWTKRSVCTALKTCRMMKTITKKKKKKEEEEEERNKKEKKKKKERKKNQKRNTAERVCKVYSYKGLAFPALHMPFLCFVLLSCERSRFVRFVLYFCHIPWWNRFLPHFFFFLFVFFGIYTTQTGNPIGI